MSSFFLKIGLVLTVVAVLAGSFAVWQTQSSFTVNVAALGGEATTTVNVPIASNPDLTRGLVGHWTFDQPQMNPAVMDSSGQGNTGYLTNFTSTTTIPGNIGQALQFDGSSGIITVLAASSINNLGPLTISAWVKAKSTGEGDLAKIAGKDASLSGGAWQLAVISTCNIGSGFSQTYIFQKLTSSGSTAVQKCAPSKSLQFNVWQHVTVTWDGTTADSNGVRFFMNGSSTPNSGSGGGLAGSDIALDFSIGNRPADDRTFDGLIDDVRLYNRVLSPEEVRRVYGLGATTKINVPIASNPDLQNGLVAHWTFDQPQMNPAVMDKSGRGNTAYLAGFTSTTTVPGKVGQALLFDGSDDEAVVDVPVGLDIEGAVSVAAWIYPRSFGGGSQGRIVDITSGASGYSFYVNNSAVSNGLSFFTNTTSSVSGVVKTKEWQHVVVVKSATDLEAPTFYVNGVASTGGSSSDAPDTSLQFFYIGSEPSSNVRNFDGYLDDVRVYNRVLSAGEAKRLYELGK